MSDPAAPAPEPPTRLPVLPLKETVVFPESMTPLAVGQERSIKLIDDVVAGERMLVISGKRPVRRTEGRAYQQVEIPTGSFRRAVELGVDIEAEEARATFADGLLRIELPIRLPDSTARRVPIERPAE
jgi:HSP20 family protein